MRADIDALKTRLDEIDKRDKEYKEQVLRLRKVLDEATALLTRNSADVGAKAAKAEQDIAALQGRIEKLSHAGEMQNRAARRTSARAWRPGWPRWSRRRPRLSTRLRRRSPTTRTSSGRRRGSA